MLFSGAFWSLSLRVLVPESRHWVTVTTGALHCARPCIRASAVALCTSSDFVALRADC